MKDIVREIDELFNVGHSATYLAVTFEQIWPQLRARLVAARSTIDALHGALCAACEDGDIWDHEDECPEDDTCACPIHSALKRGSKAWEVWRTLAGETEKGGGS